MALWSNTADGWGSDAQKSGGGNLGTYMQSSLARSPSYASERQASDPGNSMPTSSVSRSVQPAQATATSYAQPAQSAGLSRLVTSSTPYPQAVLPGDLTTAAPAIDYSQVAKPTYSGPRGIRWTKQSKTQAGGIETMTEYWDWSDELGKYVPGAQEQRLSNGQVVLYGPPKNAATTYQDFGTLPEDVARNNELDWALYKVRAPLEAYKAEYEAAKNAARDAQLKAFYEKQLQNTGKLPDTGFGSHGPPGVTATPPDVRARLAAGLEYEKDKASAANIGLGINPVDMSQQTAINQASIASLASRFGTNLGKDNIAAMGRAYAQAVTGQAGINRQLTDEAYAQGFNRNLAIFNQQIQNQATLDANATGQKLQLDIQAAGDALATLQQQAGQLATKGGQAVNAQLIDLQRKINDYKALALKYGADASQTMSFGKLIIGGLIAVGSAIAAIPTGGATLPGVGAGVAIAAS